MNIPKIIHYCWFGPKAIPELELICMESWKKYFPDYTLMFWSEKTFDVNEFPFTKQAYDNKYFAFVSDFVRAKVLKEYGGVYLDTDLEVLSNFTELLQGNEVVLGFENKTFVGTAMMATISDHFIFKEMLEYYNDLSFVNSKGELEITANPSILAEILEKYNIELNGDEQFLNGVKVYKREVFFPKKLAQNSFRIGEETRTIHHFKGSWLTERQKKRGGNRLWIEFCRPILRKCMYISRRTLGKSTTRIIENKVRNFLR